MNRMSIYYGVQWYCRECWKRGKIEITILPVHNELIEPTQAELIKMLILALHQRCCAKQDLRATAVKLGHNDGLGVIR